LIWAFLFDEISVAYRLLHRRIGRRNAIGSITNQEERVMIKKTDEELRADVMFQLGWDSRVTATDIGVAVKDGVVTHNRDSKQLRREGGGERGGA
jgi:hypothetical protein